MLTHLSVSVSREEGETCEEGEEGEEGVALTTRYVQHSVAQHGQALVQSLDSGAVVYVCGDANHMAKDVNAAFCSVIQQHKGELNTRVVLHNRVVLHTSVVLHTRVS